MRWKTSSVLRCVHPTRLCLCVGFPSKSHGTISRKSPLPQAIRLLSLDESVRGSTVPLINKARQYLTYFLMV